MITLGEIEGKVLRVLNKSSSNRGVYTAEKCYDAIEEAIDFIATEMMIADEGWLTKYAYLDTTANTKTVQVPPYVHMVKNVRYLTGDNYVRMGYDDGSRDDRWQDGSGVTQFPFKYKIVDNCFEFNPILAEGGAKYLEVEYMSYPRMPADRNDVVEGQFDRAMFHLIKYKAASVLSASFGKFQNEWDKLEDKWEAKVINLVNRRNLQTQAIREFTGGE